VFDLKLTRGPRARTPLCVEDPCGDGVPFVDRLDAAVEELIRRKVVTSIPKLDKPEQWEPPAAPEKGIPQIQVLKNEPWGEGHRLVRFLYGHFGQFETAIGEKNVDLKRHAATAEFRALVLLPKEGKSARLVVETIDRACPVTILMHWLTRVDYELHRDAAHVRTRFPQMADRARVRAMADDAQKITATLKESRPGAPGSGDASTVTLTQTITSQEKKEAFVAEVAGWFDTTPDAKYVQRIEKIAGYKPEDLDRAGLRFNQGAVTITDSQGIERKIDPERIREKFTYRVSQNFQADDPTWLGRVKTTLVGSLLEGTDIVM